MFYRIYTETKPQLSDLVSKYFDGFTLLYGRGFFLRKSEACTIIEIDTIEPHCEARIKCLVRDIKQVCEQEFVLVQKFPTVLHLG